MSKAKIGRARLGKGGGDGGKVHFLLLNDFPPPSRSLQQATVLLTAVDSL